MSNTSTGAQPESGGKGLFELIIATLPAVLLYFFGWAFLHFYLKAFSIDVSELDLDLQTIFIYSVPPLRALMGLYWLWAFMLVLVALIWVFQWMLPQFYRRIIELPAIVLGLGLFAIVASAAVASVPMIRSVAADAAGRKWSGGTGLPIEAIVKEPEGKDRSWQDNYERCSSRRALDLIFSDKESYYMLCISNVEKTTAVVFEVRRETGLVSVRFVEPQR
jgi:hypothetical protein